MKLPISACPAGSPPRDPHDVARVALNEVVVFVDQRLTHARGVLLIYAEDDRLLEAVATLLQESRDLLRHERRPLVDD